MRAAACSVEVGDRDRLFLLAEDTSDYITVVLEEPAQQQAEQEYATY